MELEEAIMYIINTLSDVFDFQAHFNPEKMRNTPKETIEVAEWLRREVEP